MSSAPELAIPAQVPSPVQARPPATGVKRWLLANRVQPVGPEAGIEDKAPKVINA